MKYRISEEMLSQMIFYNVLQCLRKHCFPEDHLGECVVDLSSLTGDICKTEDVEPYVQGALICTKNSIEEHEPPIVGILRSTHTIQIAFPKLIPDVHMFIRIDHGAISVDSRGKDPLSDEMKERITYFGDAVSSCLIDIMPPGSDIFFKEDFYQRLMGMVGKFKEFISALPDGDADDTEEDDDE